MEGCIFLFEIYLSFKAMQKVIEIKNHCLQKGGHSEIFYALWGRVKIEDQTERRTAIFYKWIANLFLLFLIFNFISLESYSFHLSSELIKTGVALFVFISSRAWPHVKAIKNIAKSSDKT